MIRNSTNDLSIRPKMSRKARMATILGSIIAVVVSLYFAYSSGIKSGNKMLDRDAVMIEQLNGTIIDLKQNLSKAEEDKIFAQRQKQIQEEAYKQISKAYSNSEQKNRILGSRLDFYRSIISPENEQSGPAIQSLEHSFEEGTLSFDVTLVQAIKHKTEVRGRLKVVLYDNDEVVGQWPLSSSRSINYQYFERISGSIDVSGLAESAKIKVELNLSGNDKLERWFPVSDAERELDSAIELKSAT